MADMRHGQSLAAEHVVATSSDRSACDVAHKRTKLDVSVRQLDAVETGNAIDVDQQRGAAQPHVESRDEALAAGEKLCVVSSPGARSHAQRIVPWHKQKAPASKNPSRTHFLSFAVGGGRVNPSLPVVDW